jgi:hypothetical protein
MTFMQAASILRLADLDEAARAFPDDDAQDVAPCGLVCGEYCQTTAQADKA